MCFSSKKDIWFRFIIWGIILGMITLLILQEVYDLKSVGNQFISTDSLVGKIIVVLFALLLAWFWFGTGYTITDTKAKYRFGPLRGSMKSIDRLEIVYGRFSDKVQIAPVDEQRFVQLLMSKNSRIQTGK